MVEDETIVNMIVCENDTTAELFGAVPAYEGARIGDIYQPPIPPPTLEARVASLENAIEKGLSL